MNAQNSPALVGQVERPVRPLVEAETVLALQTADFFVLMVRYGHDYWAAHSTHRDLPTRRKSRGDFDRGGSGKKIFFSVSRYQK